MKLKFKTKKSAVKRFRITKNGKVISKRAYDNHILTKKSSKRKRMYSTRRTFECKGDILRIKKMLNYSVLA